MLSAEKVRFGDFFSILLNIGVFILAVVKKSFSWQLGQRHFVRMKCLAMDF
jgi:hypothetical protein